MDGKVLNPVNMRLLVSRYICLRLPLAGIKDILYMTNIIVAMQKLSAAKNLSIRYKIQPSLLYFEKYTYALNYNAEIVPEVSESF